MWGLNESLYGEHLESLVSCLTWPGRFTASSLHPASKIRAAKLGGPSQGNGRVFSEEAKN